MPNQARKPEDKIPREWKIEQEKLEDLTPQLSLWLLFEVSSLIDSQKFLQWNDYSDYFPSGSWLVSLLPQWKLRIR